jgi:hypothetical protein
MRMPPSVTADSYSSIGTAHHGHKFLNLLALRCLASGRNRVLNAMSDVVTKDFLLGASQRRTHCPNLSHYVDAVTVRLDHPGKPLHLALNAAQALQARSLDVISHAPYIPLQGRCFNP